MTLLAFQYAINSALKGPKHSTGISIACRSWYFAENGRGKCPEMHHVNTRWHLDLIDGAGASLGRLPTHQEHFIYIFLLKSWRNNMKIRG